MLDSWVWLGATEGLGASCRLLGRGTGDVGHGLAVLNPLTTLLTHVEGALFAINLLYDS